MSSIFKLFPTGTPNSGLERGAEGI